MNILEKKEFFFLPGIKPGRSSPYNSHCINYPLVTDDLSWTCEPLSPRVDANTAVFWRHVDYTDTTISYASEINSYHGDMAPVYSRFLELSCSPSI